VSPAPGAAVFAVRNYPNPFNPSTRIEYTLARPGHLSLKVFNLKGELVKTLIDERRETGGFVVWDGTDDRDSQVASGVYFYEARSAGEVKVDKMVLIK
jgi:flagellar hook assembly protein FlgD